MKTMKFTISNEVEVTEEMVKDLIRCGFEGDVEDWLNVLRYKYPNGFTRKDVDYPWIDLPFLEDGGVVCEDREKNMVFKNTVLNLNSIKYGLSLLMSGMDKDGKDLQPRHRNNFLNENANAETGDVFLQLCLLGEIVFG